METVLICSCNGVEEKRKMELKMENLPTLNTLLFVRSLIFPSRYVPAGYLPKAPQALGYVVAVGFEKRGPGVLSLMTWGCLAGLPTPGSCNAHEFGPLIMVVLNGDDAWHLHWSRQVGAVVVWGAAMVARSDDGGQSSSPNFASSFSGSASSSSNRPSAGEEPLVPTREEQLSTPAREARPASSEGVEDDGSGRQSLDYGGDRVFNGIPLYLLKGCGFGSLPKIGGYDWVGHDVNAQASYYHSWTRLQDMINQSYIVRDVEDSRLIRAAVNRENERGLIGRSLAATLLCELNVAPTQLHPNAWASVQAFGALCLAAGVAPSVPAFLHFFDVHPSPKGGWVSFTSVKDRTMFKPYSESYKNFKCQFFKIMINESGQDEFHDEVGLPLFPFYWTREPRKIKAYPVHALDLGDLVDVETINALPRRLPARGLDSDRRAFDIMATPAPRQSNLMASKRGSAGVSSIVRGRAPPPPRRPPPVGRPIPSNPHSAGIPDGLPVEVSVAILRSSRAPAREGTSNAKSPPAADVGLPPTTNTESPIEVASHSAPLGNSMSAQKKRKSRKEGDKSSSKRNRREGSFPSTLRPLPGGVFSTEFNVSHCADFHMGATHWSLLEALSEFELTNAFFEMATRTTSVAEYIREFTNAELVEEKRATTGLRGELEALRAVHEETRSANSKLAETVDLLKKAQSTSNCLAGECNKLKLEAIKQKEVECKLHEQNDVLTEELARANEEVAKLRASIVAVVLLNVHKPFDVGFGIEKDVYGGELNPASDGTTEPEGAPAVDAEPVVEEVAGSVGLCHSPSAQVDRTFPFINLAGHCNSLPGQVDSISSFINLVLLGAGRALALHPLI
ncbi:hypothetical protein V8G54_019384 [Vigna mungo]|uniref:Transposase (putative) gypsy type domain-containing protein n=1 Tax=Vigna mungo TaxID=3915 RepID=A0AAQ3NCU3_VIGMU